jgi:hypothetical protein
VDKSVKTPEITQIIQTELNLDPDDPENEPFFKIVIPKVCQYN